jgi:hypothetical protein
VPGSYEAVARPLPPLHPHRLAGGRAVSGQMSGAAGGGGALGTVGGGGTTAEPAASGLTHTSV